MPLPTCEHAFVTSQGHPRTIFRRALRTRNLLVAETTAREVGRLDLAEALELVVLVAEVDARRLEAFASRWLRRLIEERAPTLAELDLALTALRALPSPRAVGALRDRELRLLPQHAVLRLQHAHVVLAQAEALGEQRDLLRERRADRRFLLLGQLLRGPHQRVAVAVAADRDAHPHAGGVVGGAVEVLVAFQVEPHRRVVAQRRQQARAARLQRLQFHLG